jgi:hypothetical protein
MKPLTRYWFQFAKLNKPTPLNLGCGVTACGYGDALQLLRDDMFDSQDLPEIVSCIENVDISTLDRNHVLPNIGVAAVRGIWFPKRK